MKTVADIYREYRIMPSLQLHQLRVAGVAKLVCEQSMKPVDTHTVVLAGLFHDMGNIIKSDLRYFPEFVEPEGLEYWEQVKADFVSKYGTDHHRANVAIAREVGIPEASVALIDGIGFSKLPEVVSDGSLERKVLQYADMRVGPHGILSLPERLEEGRARYQKTRTERPYYGSDEEFRRLDSVAEEVERQVMSQTNLAPEDLNDASVAPLIEQLRKYTVA